MLVTVINFSLTSQNQSLPRSSAGQILNFSKDLYRHVKPRPQRLIYLLVPLLIKLSTLHLLLWCISLQICMGSYKNMVTSTLVKSIFIIKAAAHI